MKEQLLHALGQRPSVPRVETEWDRVQAIKQQVCERLTTLADILSDTTGWCNIFTYHTSSNLYRIASGDLCEALGLIGITHKLVEEGGISRVSVRVQDLKRVAKEERLKSDAAFLEMQRSR